MTDPQIDPLDEENQQEKAEHEAAKRSSSPLGAFEVAADAITRPFAREKLTEEEAEEVAEETDKEERSI
ncbi:MAG: hypothetical protein ACJ789_05510 [Thermomicrobiales bacterium]